MRILKTSACLALTLAGALLLTGCEKAADAEQRGDSLLSQGHPDQARRAFQSAEEKFGKENTDASARARLDGKIHQADVAIADAERRAAEARRDHVLQLLRQAKSQCDSRDYPGMLRSLETARSEMKRVSDPALGAEVERLLASRAAALARSARVYRAMCSEAGWSTFDTIFGVNDWVTRWTEWSAANLSAQLVSATAEVGDTQLIQAAGNLSGTWSSYTAWKVAQRQANKATKDDDSLFGAIVQVGVAVGGIHSAIKYDQAQRAFEDRLKALMNSTSFGDIQYQVPQPVAAAPQAPQAPVSTAGGAAPSGSSAVTVPAAPSVACRAAPASLSGNG